MQTRPQAERAIERALDNTLENCGSLQEWTEAAKGAGAGMYGPVGPPHVVANVMCGEYRRRKASPPPQPICRQAVRKSGGIDFSEFSRHSTTEAKEFFDRFREDRRRDP